MNGNEKDEKKQDAVQQSAQAKAPAVAPKAKEQEEVDLGDLEPHEVVVGWFKENATSLMLGVLIAALGFLGYSMWRDSKRTAIQNGIQALTMDVNRTGDAKAKTSAEMTDVLKKLSGTELEPMARLSLAAAYFDETQYDKAEQTYREFLAKFPDSNIKGQAEIGLAYCAEAAGKLDDAIKAFGALAAGSNAFEAVRAAVGVARCELQAGRFDKARKACEDFKSTHAGLGVVQFVDEQLAYIDKAERQAKAPKLPQAMPEPVIPPLLQRPPQSPAPKPPAQTAPANPAPAAPAAAQPVPAPAPATAPAPAAP